MAIFDIFEEVSGKAVMKSETGDNRIFGVVVGEVVNKGNSPYSSQMPGRVCVSIHVRDNEANVIKWARLAMPSYGDEWGHYFLPEYGDQVLVVFDQGIIDRPYIIGCIAKDNSKFMKKSYNENNRYKRIVTKHGNTIQFEDVETGDGSQDAIRIFTPEEAHSIELDNNNKKITIKDKDKNACIEMSTEQGNITITAANKLTIKVGDNITVAMNGRTGKVTVNASDLSFDSTGKLLLSGSGKAQLSGASVSIESQGLMKLSSSGMAQLEGKPVKLG